MALENLLQKRDRTLKQIEDLCDHVNTKWETFDIKTVDETVKKLDDYKIKADKVNAEIVQSMDKDDDSQTSNAEKFTRVYLISTKVRTKLEKHKEDLEKDATKRKDYTEKESKFDSEVKKALTKYKSLTKDLVERVNKIEADLIPFDGEEEPEIGIGELKGMLTTLNKEEIKIEQYKDKLLDVTDAECVVYMDLDYTQRKINRLMGVIGRRQEPAAEKKYVPLGQVLIKKCLQLDEEFKEMYARSMSGITTAELQVMTENLKSSLNKVEMIMDQAMEMSGEESTDVIKMCTLLKHKVNELRITAQMKIEKRAGSSGMKFKDLEPPKFDSNALGWATFKGLWEDYVKGQGLSKKQKLQLLLSQVSGHALELIKMNELSDEGFDKAWDKLVLRYEDIQHLASLHLKTILDLLPVTSRTSGNLRKVLDPFEQALNQLEVIQPDVESRYELVMGYLLYRKLDKTTQEEYKKTLGENELPDVEMLIKHVENTAKLLAHDTSSTTTKDSGKWNKNTRRNDRRVATVNNAGARESSSCAVCQEGHQLWKCATFKKASVEERWQMLRSARSVCFRCLQSGHYTKDCESTRKCNVKGCQRSENHDSLLHSEIVSRKLEPKKENKVVTEAAVSVNAISLNGLEPVPATALVHVRDKAGLFQVCRLMLDTGAGAPCISEECVNRLSLKRNKDDGWKVKGVTGKEEPADTVHCDMRSRYGPFKLGLNALVIKDTPVIQELTKHQKEDWNELMDYPLADPEFYKKNKIDILIGPEYWDRIFLTETKKSKAGPTAWNSRFGWMIMGSIESVKHKTTLREVKVNLVQSSLDQCLRKFWELENIPVMKKPLTKEEKECEDHFETNYLQDKDGRFIVKLPFKNEVIGELGESYSTAKRRFSSLEKRIQKNPEVGMELEKCIEEYFDLDQIEEVPQKELDKKESECYYIPYHPVYKISSSTTKVRFVFDASSKTSTGLSLNDKLMNGPKLQDDLISIIMRFRTYPVAISADIAKMYRQFVVTPEHRDFQRILFRKTPSEKLKILRLKVLMFGTKVAPYLATKCVKTIAEILKEKYPLAYEKLLNDLYMDDLLSGANSVELALELQRQLLEVMKAACLEMRKWISNTEELVKSVPEEWREIEVPYKFETDDTVKALGIEWHPKLDYFSFTVSELSNVKKWTKRSLLSEIAKLFDPVGWLAPAVVRAKILMRKSWIETGKSNWDVELSTKIQDEWLEYRKDMENLKKLNIPRSMVKSPGSYQLHGFSDASEQAYSACVYLRVVNKNGKVLVSLIAAKTRVAPVKTVSIPKLELCGAALLVELMESVHQALNLIIEEMFAWTDSTTVLCWLNKEPIEWNVFVANRVSRIQGSNLNLRWLHIEGKDNPADCASRGILPSDLLDNTLWWKGPSFLSEKDFDVEEKIDLNIFVPERKMTVNQVQVKVIEISKFDKLLEKCSTLRKLKRVTAFCLRVVQRKPRKSRWVTVKEEEDALILWVKKVQLEVYGKELLKMKEDPLQQPLKELSHLTPWIDLEGILRVGGRLKNSHLQMDSKFPILLPADSRLSILILEEIHHHQMHAGPQQMVASSRQRWWILRSNKLCKRIVKNCVDCFRLNAQASQQMMANLPESRVTPGRAFLRCGVDFAGPIRIKSDKSNDRETRKMKTQFWDSYVCVFVCFSTRSVHLELVRGYDTESFLMCFDRFVSRRGKPLEVYSDQGTNFVGAKNELEAIQHALNAEGWNKIVGSSVIERGFQWKLNPAKSPHFGGLWEAAVKSMKKHLKRTVGSTVLTYSEFETVLTRIEAVLNSRPLTSMSTDPNEPAVLTPGHFLIGEPLTALPQLDLKDEPMNKLSRWQLIQQMSQMIWKRWSLEYLHLLQTRKKWTTPHENLAVDDVVLLKEDNLPPLKWKMARVTKVYPGNDGKVRVVNIKCKEGNIDSKNEKFSEYDRPVVKLCKLPIQGNRD